MKNPLSGKEIEHIADAYFDVQLFIHKKNFSLKENGITSGLKMIQVPKDLSESLVCYALQNGEILPQFGPYPTILREVDNVDIIANGIKLAVKATSIENGWIELTQSDRKCDYLVWLDFYPQSNNAKILPVTIFKSPISIDESIKKPSYSRLVDFYERFDDGDMIHIPTITFKNMTECWNPNIDYKFCSPNSKFFESF